MFFIFIFIFYLKMLKILSTEENNETYILNEMQISKKNFYNIIRTTIIRFYIRSKS